MKVIDNSQSLLFEFEPQETEYMVRQFGAYDAQNLIRTHINDILDLIHHICQIHGNNNVFSRFSKTFSVSCHLEKGKLCVEVKSPVEKADTEDEEKEQLPAFGVSYEFTSVGDALDAVYAASLSNYAIYKRNGYYYVYVPDYSFALLEFAKRELEYTCLPDDVICRFSKKGEDYEKEKTRDTALS